MEQLQKVLAQYDLGEIKDIERIVTEGAKINKTYIVRTAQRKFILQQLNTVYSQELIEDQVRLQAALQGSGITIPNLVQTRSLDYYVEADGRLYRIFDYIENDGLPEKTPELLAKTAKLLAKFHKAIKQAGFVPNFTQAHFHDTEYYYNQLILEAEADSAKLKQIKADYEFLIERLGELLGQTWPLVQTLHGDPALRNFLFKDGEPIAIIDLDTMLVKSVLYDFGDALRNWSRIKPSAFSSEFYNATCEAYLEELGVEEIDREHAFRAMELITLELACRHMLDYFQEEYFSYEPTEYASSAEYNKARFEKYLEFYNNALTAKSEVS